MNLTEQQRMVDNVLDMALEELLSLEQHAKNDEGTEQCYKDNNNDYDQVYALIKAAPEMFKTLQTVAKWFDDFVNDKNPYNDRPAADLYTITIEAIEKAEVKL